jgi:hypothetical protein
VLPKFQQFIRERQYLHNVTPRNDSVAYAQPKVASHGTADR